jgi:hypothetical protein
VFDPDAINPEHNSQNVHAERGGEVTDPDLKWFVELTDEDFANTNVDPELIIERKINKTI